MGRPRFRLEDVDAGVGGDSGIFGSLKLEKREFEYDDRTFYGMIKGIKEIGRILCGIMCRCDRYNPNCKRNWCDHCECEGVCGNDYSRSDCSCFYG